MRHAQLFRLCDTKGNGRVTLVELVKAKRDAKRRAEKRAKEMQAVRKAYEAAVDLHHLQATEIATALHKQLECAAAVPESGVESFIDQARSLCVRLCARGQVAFQGLRLHGARGHGVCAFAGKGGVWEVGSRGDLPSQPDCTRGH